MQGARIAVVTSLGYEETPIVADPRIPTYEEGLESECGWIGKQGFDTRARIDRFIRSRSSGFMFVKPTGRVVDIQKCRSGREIAAVNRSSVRRRQSPELLQEEIVLQVRIEIIKQAQEEKKWIVNLNKFLIGDIT